MFRACVRFIKGAEIPSKVRREIAERSLDFGVKIKKVLLFVNSLCNVMILKWYVVAAKNAQRTPIEG